MISNSVDLTLSSYFQYATHLRDIWLKLLLTWGISVLRGVQDVSQTLDWQKCKLPFVELVYRASASARAGTNCTRLYSSRTRNGRSRLSDARGSSCSTRAMASRLEGVPRLQ